jgi:hypothetical protein
MGILIIMCASINFILSSLIISLVSSRVASIDLVDNSRCLPEGSECETSAECCSGELSTICSYGKCRCWSGMKWSTSMRRCVPSFAFRFGAIDLDVEDDDDLFYLRNTNDVHGPDHVPVKGDT